MEQIFTCQVYLFTCLLYIQHFTKPLTSVCIPDFKTYMINIGSVPYQKTKAVSKEMNFYLFIYYQSLIN